MNTFILSTPYLFGFLIGTLGSILGAGIDLFYSRRNRRNASTSGFLLLIAGGLNTILGAASILLSILLTGSIRIALIIGLGVLTGFVLGFLIIALISILATKVNPTIDQ